MKKRVFLFLAGLGVTCLLAAQPAIRHRFTTPAYPDSVDIEYYKPNKGYRAAGLAFSLNMGVWAFDRYVREADFAYISMRSVKDNLKEGFVFDNDGLGTNMFMHPYHGSLYFNGARANGYTYWQSGLFAFGGSFMWEMFMENEYPSGNDIMATPIGGMALGEVMYRTSDMILDDRKTGASRFGLEFASFLVSPMRGLSRLLSGDAWRKRATSGKQYGTPELSIDISIGSRTLELKDEIFDRGMGVATEWNIEYGDRFDPETKNPYDYFSVKAHFNAHSSQPLMSQMSIVGRLASTELMDNKKNFLSLGLYQHFDYYDSDTISGVSHKTPYKFCAPASVGGGLIYRRKQTKKWDFNGYAHVNAVLLGGALSDYYVVDSRNYNLASGFSTKVGLNFIYKKDRFSFSTIYESYHMFTWKGYPEDIDWNTVNYKTLNAQGDPSHAILHAAGARLEVKLYKKLYLSSSFMNFTRHTRYKHYDDVFSNTSEGRLLLTYKL